jgi:hypothetical protein
MNPLSEPGVWCMPSESFPGEFEFMVVDPARLRIISFFVYSKDPIKRAPMPVWFENISSDTIRVRLTPNSEGTLHKYGLAGSTLFWTRYGDRFPWSLMEEREIPDWMQTRLEQAHAKMDQKERESEQADPANRHPSGTSVMPPADPASRAGGTPEASGDS